MKTNMGSPSKWLCNLFALLILVTYTRAQFSYEFILDNDQIFDDCLSPPPGAKNIHGLFDLSDFRPTYTDDIVTVGGKVVSVWDITPTDRLRLLVELYYYEHGKWRLTGMTFKANDFCSVMYKENEYWFEYWTRHIANNVQSKCLLPGTELIYNPYNFTMKTKNIAFIKPNARYKVVINAAAFDEHDEVKPNLICIEIRGTMIKI